MEGDAEKRVRMNLTLEAIAKAEKLEATDEELKEELDKMSEMYKIPTEDIEKALGNNLDAVKADLKIQKAVEFLVENKKTVA